MKKLQKILFSPIIFLIKLPIYFYKGIISPLLPHTCRFIPSCSNYFLQALSLHKLAGIKIGLKRLARCTPSSKHKGFDPVPMYIKGDNKWLL